MNVFLSYKKYLTVPSAEITYNPNHPARTFEVSNKPNWLKLVITNTYENPRGYTSVTYNVTIDPKYADLLEPGIRFADVDLSYIDDDGRRHLGERLDVQLEIIDNIVLTLSKDQFSFEHFQGSPAPSGQPLSIKTENAWEIVADKPWVTFSENAANGSRDIQVRVNPTGIAIGAYEATFQVDDGERIRQGKIELIVSGEAESEDFLNVSTSSMSFSEIHQEAPNRSGTFTISTTMVTSVSVNVPWLQLSSDSVPAGDTVLTVSTRNTQELAMGNHTAKIKIENGYSARVVHVLLRIVENHTSGINSGQLYFADDRNTLVLGSAVTDAEALIEFSARSGNSSRNYSRKIPYFNNLAEVVIGLEANSFLQARNLPPNFQTGAFIPADPLEMDFTIYDKMINSTAVTERQTFSQVKFLKGKTPAKAGKLTRIPSRITLPKEALVCLSLFQEDPLQTISISGSIEDEILISNLPGQVFSAIVNLANYELSEGDVLNITAGPVQVEVVIRSSVLPLTRLIYLNEWDCPEVLNLDGLVEVTKESDSTKITRQENGQEVIRIVDVNRPMAFKVGTGQMYSEEEVKWLAEVLQTKRCWLEIAGQRYEVIPTTRSLTISRTREFIRSFDLTFESAVR